MTTRVVVPFIFFFCLSFLASGQFKLEEDFDGTTGSSIGTLGWSDQCSGQGEIQISSAGLGKVGLIGYGVGKAAAFSSDVGATSEMTFSSQSFPVYVSFLIQVESATSGSGSLTCGTGIADILNFSNSGGGGGGSDEVNGMVIRSATGGFQFGLDGSSTNFTSTIYNYQETYLIVLKARSNGIDLFINPPLGGSEPAINVSVGRSGTAPSSANGLNLSESGYGEFLIDAIRVATSWSNVAELQQPTVQPTDLAFSVVSATEIDGSFVDAASSYGTPNYIVLRKAGSAPTDQPSDGTSYSVGNTIGSSTVVHAGPGTSFQDTGLTPGTDYFYAVYSFYDGGSGGSLNYLLASPLQGNAPTPFDEPTLQATNITAVTRTSNSIQFSLTPGDGSHHMVVMSEGVPVQEVPVDYASYTGNTSFGSGTDLGNNNYVVAVGESDMTQWTVTSLQPGTEYFIQAFTFNDNTATSTTTSLADFLTSTGSGNPISVTTLAAEPVTQASGISFSMVAPNSLTINYNDGDGSDRIVVARAGSAVDTDPVDGVAYTSDNVFGSGDEIGTGNFVVARGSLPGVVTGLSPGTIYHFRVYEVNGSGGTENYLTTTATGNPVSRYTMFDEPTVQTTNITVTDRTTVGVEFTVTPGNGSHQMIVFKQGLGVTPPEDGVVYQGTYVFGTGSEIGDGSFVIGIGGPDWSWGISSLQPETQYSIASFALNDNTPDNNTTDACNFLTEFATGNPITFYTLALEPTDQPDALTFTNLTNNSFTGNFLPANDNPDGYLVLMSANAEPDFLPTDGEAYSLNQIVGTVAGNNIYAVHSGPGTSFNLVTLNSEETLYFKIYAFNGSGEAINYFATAPLGGNQTTLADPPSVQASAIILTKVDNSSVSLNFTNGDGSNRLIVGHEGGEVDSDPVNGVTYAAANTFGDGGQIGAGNFVVGIGSGPFTITGLSSGTEYHFRVYEFNGSSGTENYLTSPATGNPSSHTFYSDRDALMALYNATDGPNWTNNTNWGSSEPLENWFGVQVDLDGRVTQLELPNNSLVGNLPTELADLTSLIELILIQNQLTGGIPAQLGQLSNLVDLNLGTNQLTGDIPIELGNLSSLEYLNLWANDLTGSIPPELGGLSNLHDIQLNDNQLSGTIPSELGNLMNLQSLVLHGNQLTGNIPPELGSLPNLIYLVLGDNQLTGSIPPQIGQLTNLVSFSVGNNQLTGSVPAELGDLMNLQGLWLDGNEFNDLPDFSSAAWVGTIVNFQVEQNFLDFGDIVPNVSLLNIYAPQGKTDGEESATVFFGEPYTLTVSDQYAGNIYQWYKDGVAISGATSFSFQISAFSETDEGVYYCEITNPAAQALMLTRNNITLAGEWSEPTVQSTGITAVGFGPSSITLSFTTGDGSNRLLVAKQGAPVDADPVDLMSYTSDNEFGQGSDLGSGNFVVGMGEGPITVTGLTEGPYHFRLYEFNGSGGRENYLLSTSTDNPVQLRKTWHVSNSGNDANDGSSGSPLRNIQTALSSANAGDVIKVAGGIYSEGLIPQSKVGMFGGYSSTFSETDRDLIAHRTTVKAVSTVILNDDHGCTIDGFFFDGNNTAETGLDISSSSVVMHNIIVRCTQGSAAYGVNVSGDAVIRNNVIHGNVRGVLLFGGNSADAVFKNNIVTSNSNVGLNNSAAGGIHSYNDIQGNGSNYFGNFDSPGIGDRSQDPIYVDADGDDFRLQSGSPAIDTGDPADPVGDEPPDNGGRINMGAYGGTRHATSNAPVSSPIIEDFAPTQGPVGTEVTIHGENFSGTGLVVRFSSNVSGEILSSDDNTIVTLVPDNAVTGTISVEVNGQTATSSTAFNVTPGEAPVIDNFSPTEGSVGTQVTINGQHLIGDAVVVRFNDTQATIIDNDDTQIVAEVPVGATTGPITVDVDGMVATSADDFTVTAPPVIDSFAPVEGPAGTEVTISGQHFTGDDLTVKFNSVDAVITSSNDNTIVTIVPATASDGPITVEVNGYSISSAANFDFTDPIEPAPVIDDFSPQQGSVGTEVTITGQNFGTDAPIVKFNNVEATIESNSETQIVTTVPDGATTGLITVKAGGLTAASALNFVVIDYPVVSGFSPPRAAVGSEVTITGQNFDPVPANNVVGFNGVQVTSITSASTQSLKVLVPTGATSGKITVTVNDRAGTSSEDFVVAPTITATNYPTSYDVSGTLTVSLTVDNAANVKGAALKVRGISKAASGEQTLTVTPDGNLFETTLSGAQLDDPIGVQYQFELTDQGDNLITPPVVNAFVNYPTASSDLAFPNLSFGNKVENYQIIAVPLQLDNPNVTSVFSALGEYNIKMWRLFDYSAGNREYPAFSTIVPGKGYWLIARNSVTINPGPGSAVPVNSVDAFVINLVAGWNLIGNPFNFSISWDDILDKNGNPAGVGPLKGFAAGSLEVIDVLPRYRGGFVFADEPFTLQIPALRNQSLGGRKSKSMDEGQPLDADHWSVRLVLESNGLSNRLGGIGMHPEAKLEGKDRFDEVSVPLPEGLDLFELRFAHPELHAAFNREVVPTTEEFVWDFNLARSPNHENVVIRWDNGHFGDNDKHLVLFDPAKGEVVDMREQASYAASRMTDRLQILFGSRDYIRKSLDGQLPLLGRAYPNPATNQVTIPFRVPENVGNAAVTIRVYDSNGVEVSEIAHARYDPGDYEVTWQSGNLSGLFLVRMQIGERTETIKVLFH